MVTYQRIIALGLFAVPGLMAMNEPPPWCKTDQQKFQYMELCLSLELADAQKIDACVKKYHFDLNTRCMNICVSRKDHLVYPIEWIIHKSREHKYIEALLQLGVPASGYADYSPLVDVVARGVLSDIKCIEILYAYGADPHAVGKGRDGGVARLPLEYVRACKRKIRNPIYKKDVAELQRLTAVETLLSGPRPARPVLAVPPQPGAPQPVPQPGAAPPIPTYGFRALCTPTRCIVAGVLCALVAFGVKKYYQETDSVNEDDQDETQTDAAF